MGINLYSLKNMNKLIEKIFLLKRNFKIMIQLFVDAFLILNIFLLSMYLRLDDFSYVDKNDTDLNSSNIKFMFLSSFLR